MYKRSQIWYTFFDHIFFQFRRLPRAQFGAYFDDFPENLTIYRVVISCNSYCLASLIGSDGIYKRFHQNYIIGLSLTNLNRLSSLYKFELVNVEVDRELQYQESSRLNIGYPTLRWGNFENFEKRPRVRDKMLVANF